MTPISFGLGFFSKPLDRGSSRLAGPLSRHRLGQKKYWGLTRCKKTSSTNACEDFAADAKTLTLVPIYLRRNTGPGNLSKGSSRLAGPWSRRRLGQKLFWGLKRCEKTSSTNACKDLAADRKTLTLASISLWRNTGLTLTFGNAWGLPRAVNWAAVLTPSRLIKQTNLQPRA